jgi:hypothetical protein
MLTAVQLCMILFGTAAILLVGARSVRGRRVGFWLGTINQGPWLVYFLLVGTPWMLAAWMGHTVAWLNGLQNTRKER